MSSRYDVLSLCVSRVGLREGARVAQFINEWELVVRKNGGPVMQQDFAAYWKESERTTWRKAAAFRVAFPELGAKGLPHDLMQPLLTDLELGCDLRQSYPLVLA